MKARANTATLGLTLLELVVAMALFALVAVMGLQSLTGTLRVSERLTKIDAQSAELGTALALLRNDLTSVVPMLFYPPDSAPLAAVWQSENGQVIGLSLAGQPSFQPRVTDRHFVEWRHDDGDATLTRRHWPTLVPSDPDQVTAETVVLTGVRNLELRSFWRDAGWVQGPFPPLGSVRSAAATAVAQDQDGAGGAPPAAYFSKLPDAIEITLQTEAWGELTLVQTLR